MAFDLPSSSGRERLIDIHRPANLIYISGCTESHYTYYYYTATAPFDLQSRGHRLVTRISTPPARAPVLLLSLSLAPHTVYYPVVTCLFFSSLLISELSLRLLFPDSIWRRLISAYTHYTLRRVFIISYLLHLIYI